MKYIMLIASALLLSSLVSCNSAAPTDNSALKTDSAAVKTERNRKVVMALMDALNAHDPEKIMKDEAPNFTDYGDGTVSNSNSEDLKYGLTRIFNTYPDFKSENATFLAQGNRVLVILDFTQTFKNDRVKPKQPAKQQSTKTWTSSCSMIMARSLHTAVSTQPMSLMPS